MISVSSILDANDLEKSYGKVHALKGLAFSIDEPGVIAILGQNGAGKTTLIHCALGLEKVTNGSLTTMGYQPGHVLAKQKTGVMLQDTDLPDLLTVREHITLFASYYPEAFEADQLISLCHLQDIAERRYKKLSGGQKRRVQFALAIVGNPQLVFLDEPTTGLDIEARRNLWKVIRDFAAQGKTIVLTTHYLEEADALADRIIVMNAGKVVADAKPDDIHKQFTGSMIRCQTRLSETELSSIPGVSGMVTAGRFSELRSQDVNSTLLGLLAADPDLSDLTVYQPKLEDIFTQLSQMGVPS